ncbi:MAG: adenylate/guanylate cyclase domain-containing protein, partial [Candidatus Eremiobacterota bacterium]
WTLAFCFLGCLAGFSPRWRVTLLLCLLVAVEALSVLLFLNGLIMPLAWPVGASLLSFLGGITFRFMTTDAERRRIRGLFSRYVSDQVAALVVEHPEQAALGGRSAEVTLLFSDLNHFTTWSEKTDPAEVVATLNEYFTAMEEVIFQHGGTLKQFVGDEIMVMFGAPFPQDDAEERAVRTALAMQRELERLNQRWSARGIPRQEAKFGIHRGRVVVGNVGSPRRTEYAAVGDAVNLASRVMGLTKKLNHMVLITGEVYERVKDVVVVREFEPQTVRGREEPVRVYGLEGLASGG